VRIATAPGAGGVAVTLYLHPVSGPGEDRNTASSA